MARRDFVVSFKLLDKQFKKGIGGIKNELQKLKGFAITALSGLGIANFGRSMIEAGKNFESGMARVKSVTNATQQQMKMMSDEAERLGATTKYSASQAAGALENLTRNGLTAEQATKALSKTLQLAQANSIELAEAADLTTNVMNGFGLSVDQLGRVNDNLSSTAAHSATNVLELGEAVKNVAPLANNCGINIEEVCAALGTLANVGIKGADAGTAMKQMLAGLSTEAPKGAKAMARYGLNINQATLAADGLQGTLKKLFESGIGTDNQALADIFGRKAYSGAAAIINNYEKFVGLNKTLQQSSGETERMFSQAAGKMDAAIKGLQSAWEALMIAFFKNGEGGMVGPINAMSDAIRGVRNNIDTVIKVVKGAAVFAVIAKGVATLKTLWSSYTAGILVDVQRTAAARANAEKLQTSLEAQQASIREKIAEAEGMQKRALMVQLNATAKQMQANRTLLEKAAAAERMAIERAAAMQSAGAWGKVSIALKGVGVALKAAFSTTLITAAITLVMELGSKLYEAATRARTLRKEWEDYQSEALKATHTEEIKQLQILQGLIQKSKKGSAERAAFVKLAANAIGANIDATKSLQQQEALVNKLIQERIALRKKEALAEFYTKRAVEAEADEYDMLVKAVGGRTIVQKDGTTRKATLGEMRQKFADKQQSANAAARSYYSWGNAREASRLADVGQQLRGKRRITDDANAMAMQYSADSVKSGVVKGIKEGFQAADVPAVTAGKVKTGKTGKTTTTTKEKVLPAGSMAANDKAIGDLEEKMKLTVDPSQLYALQTQLDKFKKANEVIQLRIDYNAADISGAFKKGAQLVPELKFPTSDEISAKMQGVTEAINASWLKAKEKQQAQQGAMLEATQQFASGMSSLGSAFEIPELNAAGVIAQAVANIIMSFSTAALQASSLGPWGWIAFSLAGIAQVAAMVASIKNMGTFANGGTIGGHSYTGDKLLARVNSGERILPAKKAEELDKVLAGGSSVIIPDVRLKGSDLWLSFRNENEIRKKTGRGFKP